MNDIMISTRKKWAGAILAATILLGEHNKQAEDSSNIFPARNTMMKQLETKIYKKRQTKSGVLFNLISSILF
jgi:hypothetical protein